MTWPSIGDYGLIGDCGSAALVSRDASIEWLCWPRFDSPALFAAILDRDRGGRFRVGPAGDVRRRRRRYLPGTNVLETVFETSSGCLRVRDCMAVAPGEAYVGALWPEHQVLREVVCTEGEVETELCCAPRFDFGLRRIRPEERGVLGTSFEFGASAFVLRSEIPTRVGDACDVVGEETLRAGDRRFVSFSHDSGEPATLPPLGDFAAHKLERTVEYWRGWSERCGYDGPYRDRVVRSALVLKLLAVASSGAIVAAPTTSLPEAIGGRRNWDYRFCWLRDAAFALRALFEMGYFEEGEAFFSWLLYTTRRTTPKLNVLYSIYGGEGMRERELEHLEGYRGSRPVRVGNDAENQLQLDIYGTLVSAAYEFVQRGGTFDRWQSRLLETLAGAVCEGWDQPDDGIWESRGGRQRHTQSAVMCWVALDRMLKMAEAGHVRVPEERLRQTRDQIRRSVEEHGFDEDVGSYGQTFGGSEADAALLLLALYGYADPASPRMRGTWERIQKRLATPEGLLYRYPESFDDGLSPGEGVFGVCCFWGVEYLALRGDLHEARQLFETVCSYANDLGLMAEEIDPRSGQPLGNFPQALTHLGLISAALTLKECEERRREASLEGRAPVAPKEDAS